MPGPGPRVASATATVAGGMTTITVGFRGGTAPFHLAPTQYCSVCCGERGSSTAAGDFDVSVDGGLSWVNGTVAKMAGPASVSFTVGATAKVTHLRFTANQG